MNTHLILYNSKHGQTEKICRVISAQMGQNNLICEVKNVLETDINFDLSRYRSVLLGIPVYYGNHNKKVIAFIKSRLPELKTKITGIFSVNLTARKKDKRTLETNPYLKKLLYVLGWKPDHIGVIAGALKYPEYTWYNKAIIYFIMKLTKGPVDLSVSTDFTDWTQVETFTSEYIKKLSLHGGDSDSVVCPNNKAEA